ncbi:hypothetical protein RFI_30357, partial [Reticulomyxa filosa]
MFDAGSWTCYVIQHSNNTCLLPQTKKTNKALPTNTQWLFANSKYSTSMKILSTLFIEIFFSFVILHLSVKVKVNFEESTIRKWSPYLQNNSNNNKDTNEITLLAFDAHRKHVLMMKYKIYQRYHQRIIMNGNNHLLFITYCPENIDVFNLNTRQFIKQENLPINDETYFNCFVLNAKNANNDEIQKGKNEMWLFYNDKGLSIEYNEDNNTFKFYNIRVCTSLKSLFGYAHICVNDCILFFGGRNDNFDISSSIYKYSITRNQWMISRRDLATKLCNCVA